MTFKYHINVEYTKDIKAAAYILKYVCKGNDRVALQMDLPKPLDSTADINVPVVEDNIHLIADDQENFIIDDDIDETFITTAEITEIPMIDEPELEHGNECVDDGEFIDVENYIDEIYQKENPPLPDINNNFNRGSDFVAYDEIKKYESK